jgi:hypothetical protein
MIELGFIGGDSDATWAARQKIHSDAIAMCNKERATFGKTVKDVASIAGSFSKNNILGDFVEFPTSLKTQVAIYNKAANTESANDANMTAAEHKTVLAAHATLVKDSINAQKLAEHNMAKSLKTKAVLMQ